MANLGSNASHKRKRAKSLNTMPSSSLASAKKTAAALSPMPPHTPPSPPSLGSDEKFVHPPASLLTRSSSVGTPGEHFPHKLPPTVSSDARERDYGGRSPDRFQEIREHDRTKRSSLSKTLTKNLRKDALSGSAKPKTAEAEAMAKSGATLGDAEAQRNHISHASGSLDLAAAITLGLTSDSPGRQKQARDDALELSTSDTTSGTWR